MKNTNYKILFLKFAIFFISIMTLQNSFSQETWTTTSMVNVPSIRSGHNAVWTGDKMIVWGGWDNINCYNTGGIFDALNNSWIPTTTTNAPQERVFHTGVWTGSRMIIWGGRIGNTFLNTGGIYDPISDTWTATSTDNAPVPRFVPTSVWTGSKMVVWGGWNYSFQNTGGIYDPDSNTWVPTTLTNAPSPREHYSVVWTGSKMIIWGGKTSSAWYNDGKLFDPISNTWTNMSTTNAPSPREFHTAVWTGTKMIIWGGSVNFPEISLNTGGIYDPVSDTWTSITMVNVPSVRSIHAADWTGNKMIIWGGSPSNPVNTGGIYDPVADIWTSITTVNAPSARFGPTAIWAWNRLIIWGGRNVSTPFNTGGIYTNSEITGIINKDANLPNSYSLFQNYPNPFNPETKIKFSIPNPPLNFPPKEGNVRIDIYNSLGQIVGTPVNEMLDAGEYEITWNAGSLPSGVYFYSLVIDGIVMDTKKMMLMK